MMHDVPLPHFERVYSEITHKNIGSVSVKKGRALYAPCVFPANHANGDKHPSLHYDELKGIWYCFGCHTGGGILHLIVHAGEASDTKFAAQWLKDRGLLSSSNGLTAQSTQSPGRFKPSSTCVAEYVYDDLEGNIRYVIERHERHANGSIDKWFLPRRPDGKGGWITGVGCLDNIERIAYNLRGIADAVETAKPIFLVEGEKNANRLASLDLVATTNAGGAGWRYTAAFADYFRGAKRIVVLGDNDEAGRKAACERAQALSQVCDDVRLIESLPGVREHGDVSDCLDAGQTKDELLALVEEAPRVNDSQSLNGAALLDDIAAFIRDYIVLPPAAALILALFVLHEHALEAFETTPYILISSAEKRSGKSHLLDLLKLLLARPWKTVRITAAQLVREIGEKRSTLMLDEAETVFGTRGDSDPGVAALRGIIDAGFEIDGEASISIPAGKVWKVQRIPVFSCKIFASIDDKPSIPDTVRDRGIPIRLTRKTKDTKVKRFYRREVKPLAAVLKTRAATWAMAHLNELRAARPPVIDDFEDRAFDVIEPLLAIADLAGGAVPAHALDALKELMLGEAADDQSQGVGLLSDIRRVRDLLLAPSDGEDDPSDHEGTTPDSIWSKALVGRLCVLEEPACDWPALLHGKPITMNWLAKTLAKYREYGVKSDQIKIGGINRRGYHFVVFDGAWSALCPSSPISNATGATSLMPQGFDGPPETLPQIQGSSSKHSPNPHEISKVAQVAFSDVGDGDGFEADDADAELESAFEADPDQEQSESYDL